MNQTTTAPIGDFPPAPKPCPNCGHCPTCGHTPYRPYYQPWHPNTTNPWGGWLGINPAGTTIGGNTGTNIGGIGSTVWL